MKQSAFLIIIVTLFAFTSYSQNTITEKDYERAVSFLPENITNKRVFNAYVRPHWFPDSSGLWYIIHSSEQKQYRQLSLPEMQETDLFKHEKTAKLLSDALDENFKAEKLPISKIAYKSPDKLLLTVKGKQFLLNKKDYSLSETETEKPSDNAESVSPNKEQKVFAKNYNLYLENIETGEIKPLSSAGEKLYEYGSWYGWYDIAEGENGERPERFGAEWSDDGKWVYTNICDLRTAEKMYLLDWSIDTLYRPKLLSYYRGSPGDTGMVYMHPVFFNTKTGKEIRPDLPRSTHINQINHRWSETPGVVYLDRLERGFQKLYLYRFNLETETLDTLYTETSNTNIDNFTYRLSEENKRIFFLSEKSGWRQLYSLNLETQEEKALTKGKFYINSIEYIDQQNKRIYFSASGKESGRNPYYRHLYSISFSGKNLKLLTKENRNHQSDISPNGKYIFDNYSTVNTKTITVLRKAETGEILKEISQAEIIDPNIHMLPQIFTATARDGETTIYGALWKPSDFDPNQKYPIIDNSYTGPHTQVFPTSFSQAFANQALAEFGFIVMRVDGLGSSGRSKKFHDYSYKNLGGNLEDHIGAIRQLSEQYTWIDTSKVGIFGHSAGGYDAARALLAYPDFYKVAVASSADHDHRMEKAWWPEMYMGWPVDSAYHQQSNITMAHKLKGKLLITHGGIDENVNPSATFKLAEALIKADKQFDMLILPSQRHGYTGQYLQYFRKKRWNFFIKHLLETETIWEFDWN
jgi:dipeptidyl-peptidase-4